MYVLLVSFVELGGRKSRGTNNCRKRYWRWINKCKKEYWSVFAKNVLFFDKKFLKANLKFLQCRCQCWPAACHRTTMAISKLPLLKCVINPDQIFICISREQGDIIPVQRKLKSKSLVLESKWILVSPIVKGTSNHWQVFLCS